MTGFPANVRKIITEREGGRCASCGALILGGGHIHHRHPRKAGGNKTARVNGPANGVHVCWACHDLIEHNRAWARVFGYLIPEWPDGIEPCQAQILYRDEWVLLDDDGMINTLQEGT